MNVFVAQLGESANTLVQNWTGGYRYGFPDFYAAEFPVRPMAWDRSRIYSGVIGRQYEGSKNRYNYLFDPNMYMQPGVPDGFGDTTITSTQTSVVVATAAVTTLLVIGALVASRQRVR